MFVLMVIVNRDCEKDLQRWLNWEITHNQKLVICGCKIVYIFGRQSSTTLQTKENNINRSIETTATTIHDEKNKIKEDKQLPTNGWIMDADECYEERSKRIMLAFGRAINTYPLCNGILRVNIRMELSVRFIDAIVMLGWIPYWSPSIRRLHESCSDTVYYRTTSFGEILTRAIYGLSNCYYLDNIRARFIATCLNRCHESKHEDYLIGRLLNESEIFPVEPSFAMKGTYTLLS